MPLTGQPARTLSLAIIAASSAALLLAVPRPAQAQAPQDPPPAAATRALPLLTTADLVAQSSGSGNGKKKSKPIFEYKDHPVFHLGPADISPKARVQYDSRHSQAAVSDIEDQQGDVARQRIGVEGVVAKAVDFQVEYELDDSNDPWRDVYVNVSKFEFAQVARQVAAAGFEENTSAADLTSSIARSRRTCWRPAAIAGGCSTAAHSTSRIYDYGVSSTTAATRFRTTCCAYGDQTKVFHGAGTLRFMKMKQIRDAEIGGSGDDEPAEGLGHSRPNGARSSRRTIR